ncbi:MAG: hypothetical protein ACRDY6_17085 [Acidimicrobiia bacterium]
MPETRARRRAARSRRSRPLQIVTVIVVLALVGAAAVFFLREDSAGDGSRPGRAQDVSIGDLELTVGGVFPVNAGPPVALPPEVQNAVMTTLDTYVEGGLIAPVRDGEPSPDIASAFDAGAATRLEGPDRVVLFDEGLPVVTKSFEPTAQPVIITALSDGASAFVIATATLVYAATLETDEGTITVNRTADLTMVPEPDAWRITSYDVIVARDGPGKQVTTTTAVT